MIAYNISGTIHWYKTLCQAAAAAARLNWYQRLSQQTRGINCVNLWSTTAYVLCSLAAGMVYPPPSPLPSRIQLLTCCLIELKPRFLYSGCLPRYHWTCWECWCPLRRCYSHLTHTNYQPRIYWQGKLTCCVVVLNIYCAVMKKQFWIMWFYTSCYYHF